MTKWIKCSEELPIVDGIPTYDWVLVTSERKGTWERWPITFARYTGEVWDFFYSDEEDCHCPVKSDFCSSMHLFEITHWMPVPESPER